MNSYAAAEPMQGYRTEAEIDKLGAELDDEIRHSQQVYVYRLHGLTLTLSDRNTYVHVVCRRGAESSEFGYMLFCEPGARRLVLTCGRNDRGSRKVFFDPTELPKESIKNAILAHLVNTATQHLSQEKKKAEASVLESSEILYKDEDIILSATASATAVSYEIGVLSRYGTDIVSRFGNSGTAEITGSTLRIGSRAYQVVDSVSALACVRRHVLDQVNAPVAAVEPKPVEEPTAADVFSAYQDVFTTFARRNPGKILYTYKGYQVHIDGSGDREHDRGLVPLYMTRNGVRLHSQDDDNDFEWPNPFVRFYMQNRQMFSFNVLLPLLNDYDEVKLSVPVVNAKHFPEMVEKALAKTLPRLIDKLPAHSVATAATKSFTVAFSRSIGLDGKKLIGKTVFGVEILEVEVLENADVVSLRCRTETGTLFLAAAADGTVTVQAFAGVRLRLTKVTPKSAKLNAVVEALESNGAEAMETTTAPEPDLEDHVAEAAVEPGGAGISSVFAQLSNMKFNTKHFRVELNHVKRPTVDDQQNMYLLGTIHPDVHAQLLYGEPNFQYGFSVATRLRSTSSDVYVRMPHVYPNPASPATVSHGLQIGTSTDDVTELARGLVKVMRTWLQELDQKIEAAEHVPALLTTLQKLDQYESKCYVAKVLPGVQKKPGPYLTYGRTIKISLKPAVLDQILDEENADQTRPQRPLNPFRFACYVWPDFLAGPTLQAAIEAGPEAYGARFVVDTMKHKGDVDKTEVESIFSEWLREYMQKLDRQVTINSHQENQDDVDQR